MAIPVEQLVIQIGGDAKNFKKAIGDVRRENRSLAHSMKAASKAGVVAFAALGGAATALGVQATRSFKNFEKGAINVAKTTNLAGKDFEDFKDNIIAMSEEMPVSTDRLLEIATAAGQLGIAGVQDLTKFTNVIAKLGATTNVEGEEAALTLARLLNITGESVDSVDRLGAALVDLGNNFAASEAEILEISKDLGRATVQFGLGSDAILGMSAAMASLGIQAEAGGTVVGKAFQQISTIIRSQTGPEFEKLQKLTGMTGDELTRVFADDASAVFTQFIDGLGKAGAEGRDMASELNALGLSGIRVEKILPTLASRSDILASSMKRAGEAAEENSALNQEAAKAFESSASKLEIAQNKINKLFVRFGEQIAPTIIDSVEEITEKIEANQKPLQNLVDLFASGVSTSVDFAGGLGIIAEGLKALITLDFERIKQLNEEVEAYQVLQQYLRDNNMTMEEYNKIQADSIASLKKHTEQVERSTKVEADAQSKRTSSFLKNTSDYEDAQEEQTEAAEEGAKDRKKALLTEEEKAAKIKKAAADKALKEQKQAERARLDQQLEADGQMFDEIESFTDDVVWEQEQLKMDVERFDREKWQTLDEQQKEAHIQQIDAAIEHAQKMGQLEQAGALRRYKQDLQSKQKKETLNEKWNERYEENLEKHNEVMAGIEATRQDARYKLLKTGMDEISALQDSENNELKQIGKAAALIQVGISTIEGAQKAYASLAWIPYVGVPLGVAAAAVVSAYGIEQAGKIRAMKIGGVFGTDGASSIVPGVGTGDKVNAFLEPGELVIPSKLSKQIMKEYGSVRGMQDGGAVGEDQKTGLHNTFAQIFKVPAIFKALIAGEDGKTEAQVEGGFGADSFDGMVPRMMEGIRESANKQNEEANSVLPGGSILAALMNLLNKPANEIHDVMQDNAVTKFIGDNLGSDAAAVLTGGGPLTDAVDEAINRLVDDVNGAVLGAFGFKNGGIVGRVAPGEMRISQEALKSIASGVNMTKNINRGTQPTIRSSSNTSSAMTAAQQRMIVELYLNDNAAEIINAQIREGSELGTIIPV